LCGGCCAFSACFLVGARHGRFVLTEDENGSYSIIPRNLEGHNTAYTTLGVLILWFGWYFFNGGSSGGVSPSGITLASRACVNTTLSCSVAALCAVCFSLYKSWSRPEHHGFSIIDTQNGLLAGLVAITGPCAFVDTWASLVIGVLGYIAYALTSKAMLAIYVDDPLDAIAVHGGGGLVGMICTGLFATQSTVEMYDGKHYGLLMGGGSKLFVAQIATSAVIILWSAGIMWLALAPYRLLVGSLRLSLQDEFDGADLKYFEGFAYPDFEFLALTEEEKKKHGKAATVKMTKKMVRFDSKTKLTSDSPANENGAGSMTRLEEHRQNKIAPLPRQLLPMGSDVQALQEEFELFQKWRKERAAAVAT